MSVLYGNLEILDVKQATNNFGGKRLLFSFKQTTRRITAPETTKVYVGWRYAYGNGDINYGSYWNIPFTEEHVGTVVDSFYTYDAIHDCDYLFCGGTITFYLKAVSADDEWESDPYQIMLPSNFVIPTGNYMIPERPTQQTQDVYYNGGWRGEAGCCVASALVAAKEVQEMRSGRGIVQNSVGWFFGATADNEYTTTYTTALNFLRDTGMMPYRYVKQSSYIAGYPDVYLYNDVPGCPGARSLYLNHQDPAKTRPQKIKSWKLLTNGGKFFNWQGVIDAIQRVSGNGSSVVVMTLGLESAIFAASGDGVVGDCRGNFTDGHMMLALGWKAINGRMYWVCQNSWGSDSGDDGLYYIPFTNVYCCGTNEILTGIYDFYELVDDPNAPDLPIPTVEPWSWTASNGSASATATRTAHAAVTGRGKTTSFSYLVWNDMVDKVREILEAKGLSWDARFASYANTKMTSSDKVISAARFNSLRFNIGSHYSTGIDTVGRGDLVYGSYFTTLTNCVNEWILY